VHLAASHFGPADLISPWIFFPLRQLITSDLLGLTDEMCDFTHLIAAIDQPSGRSRLVNDSFHVVLAAGSSIQQPK
jgi:hypothetical protein